METDDTEEINPEQLIEELSKLTTKGMVDFIGRCVIAWSAAERGLESLLVNLLFSRGLPSQDAKVVVANLDLRERARITIGLAYQANLSRKRVLAIEKLANRMSDDLRTRRNRLLHDSWSISRGLISKRASTGTKLARPQAWQLDLLVPDYEPVEPAALAAFIDDCLKVADAMMDESEHLIDQAARHLPSTQPPKFGAQSPHQPRFWQRVLRHFR
jgi:hypothetical protein